MDLGTKYMVSVVKSADLDDLNKLMTSHESPIFRSEITVGELMAFKDSVGVTNAERIYSLYSYFDFVGQEDYNTLDEKMASDIQKYKSGDTSAPTFTLLKIGTTIAYPLVAISERIPFSSFDESLDAKYDPFDKDYLNSASKKEEQYTLSKNIVLLHSRALSLMDKSSSLSKSGMEGSLKSGAMLDITRYTTSFSHNKSVGFGESGTLYLSDTATVKSDSKLDPAMTPEYILNSNSWGVEDYGGVREPMTLLSHIIHTGDLIFIKRNATNDELRLVAQSCGAVSGMIDEFILSQINFDIIGRVSQAPVNRGVSSGNISVSFEGIQSILRYDGSSYMNQLYLSGKARDGSGILTEQSSGIVRIMGAIQSEFQLLWNNPIDTQIRFIMDYMSAMIGFEDLPNSVTGSRTMKIKLDKAPDRLVGLMRLLDVKVDGTITPRRILSGQIGNMYEPLESQIMRFIPEHLSEIIVTRKDNMTRLNVRRPPTDYVGISHYVDNQAIPVISQSQLKGMSLDYDPRAYSWYRLSYNFFASLKDADLSWLIPAKLFDELFELYGDSSLQVMNPYVDKLLKTDTKNDKNTLTKILKQTLVDMRYIIQSNAYLPYSRRGTLTLAKYDDRIKDGNWIFNEYTGEIFMVEGVQSGYGTTVSGQTDTMSISVSRGLILSNLDDYMNIISMPIVDIDSSDLVKTISATLSSWKVNKEILSKLMYNRDARGWSSKIMGR